MFEWPPYLVSALGILSFHIWGIRFRTGQGANSYPNQVLKRIPQLKTLEVNQVLLYSWVRVYKIGWVWCRQNCWGRERVVWGVEFPALFAHILECHAVAACIQLPPTPPCHPMHQRLAGNLDFLVKGEKPQNITSAWRTLLRMNGNI